MKIFPLEKSDFSRLASVKDIDFTDAWNYDMLLSAFSTGNFFGFTVKEESKSEALSFITFSVSIDSIDIEDVYTFSKYRKKGFAKMLINSVIDYAKEHNKLKIFLEVKKTNEKAIRLYQSLGFNLISERKKYYADGETALVMTREI